MRARDAISLASAMEVLRAYAQGAVVQAERDNDGQEVVWPGARSTVWQEQQTAPSGKPISKVLPRIEHSRAKR